MSQFTSFVLPAYNEASLIGPAVESVHDAAKAAGLSYEVIVADDNSDDGTGAIAEAAGARVVRVEHRQIAATRNSGATVAKGPWLVFVDGDTCVTAEVIAAAVRALEAGAIGGGCQARFEGRIPLYARMLLGPTQFLIHRIGATSGCFVFCTRDGWEAAGGYDETLYASEEVGFCRRLGQHGKFVVLREYVVTSGRKIRTHGGREIFGVIWRVARGGRKALERRDGLDIWYGERRVDS